MQSPNILLTNFCNQNCSFCFASSLMKTMLKNREMSIAGFGRLLNKIKRNKKIDTIKLLGGEPTLHSKFEKIITLALKKFKYVKLYTNGLFPQRQLVFLKQRSKHLRFIVNIMTPSFLNDEKTRKIFENNIIQLASNAKITLSLTINPNTNTGELIRKIGRNILNNSHCIRIGASNPIAGKRSLYSFSDFKKLGEKVIALVKIVKSINRSNSFYLDCGYTPCMFSPNQLKIIKKNFKNHYLWGCPLGNMDIRTDLKAIICYALSEKIKIDLKRQSLDCSYKQLVKKQCQYQLGNLMSVCKKCQYFGYGLNQCSGPCIAFSINKKNL